MDRKRFVLWPDKSEIKVNCLTHISHLDPGKTWDVVITQHVNSKTAEQRGWFHKLCQIWGAEAGLTLGEMKTIIKGKYFGLKEVEFMGMTVVMPDGHTESLGWKHYSGLIELTYQMAAEAGVLLPPADPYRKAP